MERIVEEAIASLQAQLAAQQLMLLSLVKNHPQPAAVLEQWRGLWCDAAERKSALPRTSRHSDLVRERCEDFAEQWTAQLIEESLSRNASSG